MPSADIIELQMALSKFAEDRDWQKYHTPANLAKSLSIEASELLQVFQWEGDKWNWKSIPNPYLENCKEEAADVFIYLLMFCDSLGIDIMAAAKDKMAANARKYPVKAAKGNCNKYSEL